MKRVLVIEDNEDNLYLIKFILTNFDMTPIVAMKGFDGYKMALEEKPELILMDIQLPDISGLEVTKMIRAAKEGESVPIIAITSYAMPGDRQKALAAGCTGYIEKPINPETFIDDINKFLKTDGFNGNSK